MFASEVILDQLQEVQAMGKPLVASMGSVAASGGYYISMEADEIWASESTISGSIGVGAMFPTFQRSLAAVGVNVDGFGTTELTGQITPVKELGDKVDSETKTKVADAISALKKAMETEDVAEIKRLSEELTNASHKLAEAMYQQASADQQQAGAAGGSAEQPGGAAGGSAEQHGGAAPEKDVVDADFEEVKEDDKK